MTIGSTIGGVDTGPVEISTLEFDVQHDLGGLPMIVHVLRRASTAAVASRARRGDEWVMLSPGVGMDRKEKTGYTEGPPKYVDRCAGTVTGISSSR